jgi:hypothetical protein
VALQKHDEPQQETWHSASVEVNIALAIVGLGYLLFAGLQWKVLLWAFLADHRPRLGIRQIALLTTPDDILVPDSEGRLKPNNGIEMLVRLINRGGSDAKIIEGNISIRVDERGGMESILKHEKILPPFDVEKGTPIYSDEGKAGEGVTVKPAEPYSINRTMRLGSDRDAVEAYLAVHRERNIASVALHVFGYFRYRSPGWRCLRARRTYFTAFCRRYDAVQGRFVATDEPD